MDIKKLLDENYIFCLDKNELSKFCKYQSLIKKRINNGQVPTLESFERLMNVFRLLSSSPELSKEDKAEIKQITMRTIERFSGKVNSRENYAFLCRKRITKWPSIESDHLDDASRKSTYYFKKITLETMVEDVIPYVFKKRLKFEFDGKEKWDKNKSIQEIYAELLSYVRANLSIPLRKKNISHYKLTVIAFFIGEQMGYKYISTKPANGKYYKCGEMQNSGEKLLPQYDKHDVFKDEPNSSEMFI